MNKPLEHIAEVEERPSVTPNPSPWRLSIMMAMALVAVLFVVYVLVV